MFTPRLAISYSATILSLSHLCSVVAYFWNIPYIGARQHADAWARRALSRLLPHYYRDANMDRASQVLAQDMPPGVPTLYRALTDHHGNVSHSTLHHRAHG
jgi:hypothetical protein